MKIISKKFWQDMKKFVEQISRKLWRILCNQDGFGSNYAAGKHTNRFNISVKISVEILISTDIQMVKYDGGGATRPLPRDGGVEESTETQQSGHAPRSGPEVKNGRRSAKDARRRSSDAGQSRRR